MILLLLSMGHGICIIGIEIPAALGTVIHSQIRVRPLKTWEDDKWPFNCWLNFHSIAQLSKSALKQRISCFQLKKILRNKLLNIDQWLEMFPTKKKNKLKYKLIPRSILFGYIPSSMTAVVTPLPVQPYCHTPVTLMSYPGLSLLYKCHCLGYIGSLNSIERFCRDLTNCCMCHWT